MKKVAIVTPEALSPRSFLWDELSERFKVKINNVVGNSLVQEEDGLYVFGDGNIQPSTNNVGRVRLKNNGFNLPHFNINILDGDETANIEIIPKVNIDVLLVENVIYPETSLSQRSQLNQNTTYRYWLDATFRIAYICQDNIVVMDVFLVWDDPRDGFVDIVINAKTTDFPLIDNGGTTVIIPEPVILT